jgi:hypothetical protein
MRAGRKRARELNVPGVRSGASEVDGEGVAPDVLPHGSTEGRATCDRDVGRLGEVRPEHPAQREILETLVRRPTRRFGVVKLNRDYLPSGRPVLE